MAVETQSCPCVVVRCDNCQEALGSGDYDFAHYEDAQAALDAARDSDWFIEGGVLICLGCCEDAPFYEVGCPVCGVDKEESCIGGKPLFCEERIAAFAAIVKEKLNA